MMSKLTNEQVLKIAPMNGNFSQLETDAFCAGYRRCLENLSKDDTIRACLTRIVELEAIKQPYITVTSGLRGTFPVKMAWNHENGGFWEPTITGESCRSHSIAIREGRAWAKAEGIGFR